MIDLYQILGVSRDASPEDVQRAYREKAKAAHPDLGGSHEAFNALRLAKHVLCDAARRKRYDDTGEMEDGAVLDDPDNGAWQKIAQALMAVVTADWEPSQVDLVAHLETAFRDHRAELGMRLEANRRALARTLDIAGRFTPRNGENRLGAALRWQAEAIARTLPAIKAEIAQLERASELIAGYRFRKEAPPAPLEQVSTGEQHNVPYMNGASPFLN